MSAMPIVYKNQTNAWMNSKIFSEYFENIFIPAAKEDQFKGVVEKNLFCWYTMLDRILHVNLLTGKTNLQDKKECNSIQLFMLRKLCYLAAKKIWGP